MAYLMVALVILCNTVKGYSGKKTSGLIREMSDAFLFNFLRMGICILIGLVLVIVDGALGSLRLEGGMLAICALAGFSNAAFLAGWILAVRKNSMVSLDVSMTMGSLIPAIVCAILFAEPISIPKMIGFALIVVATAVLAGHNKKTVGSSFLGVVLLIITTLGDGLAGVAQQLYRQYYTEAGSMTHEVFYPKTVYHFYTYVFSAVALLAVLLVACFFSIRKARENGEERKLSDAFRVPGRAILHIIVMAACLFAVNYFQTVATNDYSMPSQMLYPIVKGGCLITVNFTAMIFFGEKITVRSVIGSLIALAGIVSMSVL